MYREIVDDYFKNFTEHKYVVSTEFRNDTAGGAYYYHWLFLSLRISKLVCREVRSE
jgi:hypothetical protein